MKLPVKVEIWDGGDFLFEGELLEFSMSHNITVGIVLHESGFLGSWSLGNIKILQEEAN